MVWLQRAETGGRREGQDVVVSVQSLSCFCLR